MTSTDLRDLVRRVIEESGESLSRFADRHGIPVSTLHNWAHGGGLSSTAALLTFLERAGKQLRFRDVPKYQHPESWMDR